MPAPTWRDGAEWLKDPNLWEHATPRQRVYIEAVKRIGTMGGAASELQVRTSVVSEGLKCARERAAAMGHAPGHFEDGVAPGYRMGKVTVQRARSEDGSSRVERVWERQHPEDERRRELFLASVQALKEDLPRAEPLEAPERCNDDLITVYPQGDPHGGLYAWAAEVGEGFDLAEFERVNLAAIDHLVSSAPPAVEALYIDLGDTTHVDDNGKRTKRSGHVLDVHGRHSEIVRVSLRLKRHHIARMLKKHRRLTVRINPGNHDDETALSLAIMLEAVYENEPRIDVVTSPNRYWYKGFGSNLFGTTHGDGAKGKDLPLIMATDVPQMWAQSEHGARVFFVGHVHHKDIKDYPGVTVEYTRTLAGQDAWSHGAGYRSKRTMEAITYHRTDGEVARSTVGMAQINRSAAA